MSMGTCSPDGDNHNRSIKPVIICCPAEPCSLFPTHRSTKHAVIYCI